MLPSSTPTRLLMPRLCLDYAQPLLLKNSPFSMVSGHYKADTKLGYRSRGVCNSNSPFHNGVMRFILLLPRLLKAESRCRLAVSRYAQLSHHLSSRGLALPQRIPTSSIDLMNGQQSLAKACGDIVGSALVCHSCKYCSSNA